MYDLQQVFPPTSITEEDDEGGGGVVELERKAKTMCGVLLDSGLGCNGPEGTVW